MTNSCMQYHEETSYDRQDMSGHYLDWANQPDVYKEYPGIAPLPLPREVDLPKRPLSSLIKERAEKQGPLDITGLSRLLLLTNTLTAKARHPGGDFFYRSAASAGALYPTEIYVATCGIDGLEDGLYHFAIHRHGLCPLRQGHFSSRIREMAQGQGNKAPKLTFFFTSEGRVDFRQLVKRLVKELNVRVEMRQVGIRNQAKMCGGLGRCGRNICCSAFIDKFEPVSIRMAKEQNLSLNPTKISGLCGRLMCCLAFEQSTYKELKKGLPKVGKMVQTKSGRGKVLRHNVIQNRTTIRYEDGQEVETEIKEIIGAE